MEHNEVIVSIPMSKYEEWKSKDELLNTQERLINVLEKENYEQRISLNKLEGKLQFTEKNLNELMIKYKELQNEMLKPDNVKLMKWVDDEITKQKLENKQGG